MPGLRHFVKDLGELRHRKEKLFAIEQEKLRGCRAILHPSQELLDLIDTRVELRAVAKVIAR